MERTHRKVYQGVVVSDKMDKTIVVEVSTSKRHGMYGKRVKYSPLSATKRFRLVKIVEKAVVL